jgi:hypothetical protein
VNLQLVQNALLLLQTRQLILVDRDALARQFAQREAGDIDGLRFLQVLGGLDDQRLRHDHFRGGQHGEVGLAVHRHHPSLEIRLVLLALVAHHVHAGGRGGIAIEHAHHMRIRDDDARLDGEETAARTLALAGPDSQIDGGFLDLLQHLWRQLDGVPDDGLGGWLALR